MASIAISAVAMAAGASRMAGAGSGLANMAMSLGSTMLDPRLTNKFSSSGACLRDLSIQSSSYGKMLPIVYGTVRLAGNIIWAMPVKESASTSVVNYGGGKGGNVRRTHTEFSYSVNLAISLCEGEIDEVQRVWADTKLLDLTRYTVRIYKGGETQMPDPLIEGVQGKGKTPAYRGQAYVVFENFPLGEFGNNLPNFTFEVKRNIKSEKEERLEDIIESIVIIPGSGEFVYDTISQVKSEGNASSGVWCQRGKAKSINQHNISNKANALVALDQMKETLPNIKWAAPVVTWFGTNMNAQKCKILPGVEYKSEAKTMPDTWKVAEYERHNAHSITKVNNRPVYGGTINDASIVRYLTELKARGYKVMFYPMFFMDTPKKPWRGRVTGDPQDVRDFFTKEQGYNSFILHYANLTKDLVDAFVIGSEMIGLTKVSDNGYSFPAVEELIKLAAQTKAILGNEVTITYAADWSEYHHTDGGWYNLDPLWSCPDIDVIGIDAYFPLTQSSRSVYNPDEIIKGWTEGEGYNYYYDDSFNKTGQTSLDERYAWKNIEWWWSNEHINPDGSQTSWKPKSKKIWFTEYGFPSVDCCTNMPNVFYSPGSQESYFPYLSSGRPDFKAQRAAIYATEKKWQNSEMIERKFLWTWDARPYPFWPDLMSIWSDGGAWQYGHWVQGKLGLSSLAAVVGDLSARAGLSPDMVEATKLDDALEGMFIENQSTIRSNIELLQQAYFFDTIEINGKLEFLPRQRRKVTVVASEDLLENLVVTRTQEIELPRKVDVNFINIGRSYRVGNQHAVRAQNHIDHCISINMPICMSETFAQSVASTSLYNIWMERTRYTFALSMKYMHLTCGDLVQIAGHIIRLTSITYGNNYTINFEGVAENPDIYSNVNGYTANGRSEPLEPLSPTRLEVLDIPALPNDFSQYEGHVYMAAVGLGENWAGASIFASLDENSGYERVANIDKQAAVGNILEKLPDEVTPEDSFIINLIHGELEGNSLAVVGDEVIGFETAKLIGKFQYRISGITRGNYGSLKHHTEGERFVLLNQALYKHAVNNAYIGKTIYIKAVTNGDTLSSATPVALNYQANTLKPYAPTNITHNITEEGYIHFQWTRRSRLHAAVTPPPLGEEREEYQYILLHEGEIVVSGKTSNPECTIKTNLTTNLTFKVAQTSAITGAGEWGAHQITG